MWTRIKIRSFQTDVHSMQCITSFDFIKKTGSSREKRIRSLDVLLDGKMYRVRENRGILLCNVWDLFREMLEKSFKLASIRRSSIEFLLHPHLTSYGASKGMLYISLCARLSILFSFLVKVFCSPIKTGEAYSMTERISAVYSKWSSAWGTMFLARRSTVYGTSG